MCKRKSVQTRSDKKTTSNVPSYTAKWLTDTSWVSLSKLKEMKKHSQKSIWFIYSAELCKNVLWRKLTRSAFVFPLAIKSTFVPPMTTWNRMSYLCVLFSKFACNRFTNWNQSEHWVYTHNIWFWVRWESFKMMGRTFWCSFTHFFGQFTGYLTANFSIVMNESNVLKQAMLRTKVKDYQQRT